jgi:hypothetical protein
MFPQIKSDRWVEGCVIPFGSFHSPPHQQSASAAEWHELAYMRQYRYLSTPSSPQNNISIGFEQNNGEGAGRGIFALQIL